MATKTKAEVAAMVAADVRRAYDRAFAAILYANETCAMSDEEVLDFLKCCIREELLNPPKVQ